MVTGLLWGSVAVTLKMAASFSATLEGLMEIVAWKEGCEVTILEAMRHFTNVTLCRIGPEGIASLMEREVMEGVAKPSELEGFLHARDLFLVASSTTHASSDPVVTTYHPQCPGRS